MTNLIQNLKNWAKRLKQNIITLWFCQKHPDMPLFAKLLAILVVSYAFSPIDLIPDFIPVLGFLDDVILLPLGIYFTLELIPQNVLKNSRQQAEQWLNEQHSKPKNWGMAIIISLIWLGLVYVCYQFLRPYWQ